MANSVSLTNRVDLVVDSLYVFSDEGRINIPFEIQKRATIDYVNEIRDDLKNDPNITGTLTTDNLIANDDITSKGLLKVDTITSFEAPHININNNVVMSGSLTVGTSNIISALGTKANQITTYTKTETNQQIANVVNGAPELLNTLVESQTKASTPSSPQALRATSSEESPTLGFGSNFQSPVCNTFPAFVLIIRACISGAEWVNPIISIENGPSSSILFGSTSISLISLAKEYSANFAFKKHFVNFVA